MSAHPFFRALLSLYFSEVGGTKEKLGFALSTLVFLAPDKEILKPERLLSMRRAWFLGISRFGGVGNFERGVRGAMPT